MAPRGRSKESLTRPVRNPEPADIELFCKSHKIHRRSDVLLVQQFFDELLPALATMRSDIGRRGTRAQSTQRIRKHIARLDDAARWVGALLPTRSSPTGWVMVRPYLHNYFQGACVKHLSRVVDHEFLGRVIKIIPPETDEVSLRIWAHNALVHNAVAVFHAVLVSTIAVLKDVETSAVPTATKGGRPRNEIGHWLLMCLCELFAGLKRKPGSDPNGPFGRFASEAVDLLGLPTGWLDSQIWYAVSEWKARRDR